ncbi:17829_t:CDS:2 [Funneliformis geosporum]|nr:17829_t:CDS:2 [Funneliformis geosporum]
MNSEEIAQYQYQLDQVNLALKSEPENSELLKLKTDLTEFITLTTTLIDQEVTLSPSKRSTSSVSPRNNSTPTTPTLTSLPTFTKPLQVGDSCLARWSGDGQFYQAQITAIGGVNEQNLKQKSWLAFASGSATAPGKRTTKVKRLVQPPINKKSIFATPENPEGKVGVVGSGKPMTQFQQRGKHIFDRD